MEHNIASNIVKTPFSCARDELTIRGHIFRAAQTKNAAESIGLEKELGSLEPGKHADITIFDERLQIKKTIVDGKIVFG